MADADTLLKEIQRLERAAYRRGWKDAVDSIMTAARQGMPAPIHLGPDIPTPAVKPDKPTESGVPAIQVIYNIIEERPGLRGAEVFRAAVARIPGSNFKTMDRTGRTALMRLKKRGLIHQRMKKWYPKEKEAEKG